MQYYYNNDYNRIKVFKFNNSEKQKWVKLHNV